MEQLRTTDPDEAKQTACPAWLRKRMRRNLVRASLNRTDKPRAQQALDVLAGLDHHAEAAIPPGQRPRHCPPNTPGVQAIPGAAELSAKDVWPAMRKAFVDPVVGVGQDRHDADRPEMPTNLQPCLHRGATPPTGPAGPASQDP